MEFLESLYEIENFGIYLFVIIGILVVLFLVVLFFGRKDQKTKISVEKKSEKEETTIQKEETLFKDVSEPLPVEVPVREEVIPANPVIFEPAPKEEANSTTNVVLNSSIEPEPQIDTVPIEKEFDFDALADAISKELETIDNNSIADEPIIEEKIPVMPEISKVNEPTTSVVEENNFQIFEPVKIESMEEEKFEEPVEESKNVVKPRTPMPTVFSSVYVNREKEEVKPAPVTEPTPIIVEKPLEDEVTPIKPTIDLPKMVDLPKRVEEAPVIKPVIEEQNEATIFPSINN